MSADHDIIVVGSGVAGTIAAAQLAERGLKVLILEAGPSIQRADAVDTFRASPLKTPESAYPNTAYAPHPVVIDLDQYYVQKGPEKFASTYERIAGGSTWHWLGTALRLIPSDFELKSQFGVGVDWPISYADLEPWYGKAESELGVSGIDTPGLGAPRSAPYPMPPIPQSYSDKKWDLVAQKLGLEVSPTPQARNSVARQGRPACCGNNSCIPICPIGAKYDATVHLDRATKAGAQLIVKAVVRKCVVTPELVTVTYLDPAGQATTVTGRTLVLAANAIETPKLMLLSKTDAHPNGLGNESDAVGRYLMDHSVKLSWALSPEPVYQYRGPLSTSGIEQLRDGAFRKTRGAFRVELGNDGWDWPVAPPEGQAAMVADKGVLGKAGLQQLKDGLMRQLRVGSLVEPDPNPENRVQLAAERDAIGIPRPQLSYSTGAYADRGLVAAQELHEQLFQTMGATEIQHKKEPQGAGHLMGTCRMGVDPTTSVVDADLRLHGYRNCFVLGAAVFPTVGTANPTLTIAALSLRAVESIAASLQA